MSKRIALLSAAVFSALAFTATITVGVSKFSPPIPHTLSKVGIAMRLARSDLANWPTAEALEVLV